MPFVYGVKRLYQWVKEVYKKKTFSVHSCYLIFIFLIFIGLWCVSLVNSSLLPLFLFFSLLSLLLINYFRFRGYYIATLLFLITYGYKYFLCSSSIIWGIGITSSFLLSWGILSLILSYIDRYDQNKELMYTQLHQEYESAQSSYNYFLKEKEEKIQDLEKEKLTLQQELDKVQFLLQDSLKKQAYLAEDLQILSDQKASWSSDYAILHNEYVKLIMRDESMNAFSWISSQEKQNDSTESEFSFPSSNTKDSIT